MSIIRYEKGGVQLWQVYIDIKSRNDRRIRVQRRVSGLADEKSALHEERRLFRELTEQLRVLESKGLKWRDIIDRWVRYQELFPSKRYARTTIHDYSQLLNNWTRPWMGRVASELTRGDARFIFLEAQAEGKSATFCRHLRNTINLVFNWGIEERLIHGTKESPCQQVVIEKDREEKIPESLSVEEIRQLLALAKEQRHPWYPVWVMAALTGCRSGELQALQIGDLELATRESALRLESLPAEKRHYGLIRVRRNWNARLKQVGPTKAGYWRSVPISGELYWFILDELKVTEKSATEPLLPAFSDWRLGMQATILRGFCEANSIPSVKFHTLRACFATQLISSGVPATVVMKICGWKDLKTMQRYIRLAGVEESGATERLKFLPGKGISEGEIMEKVVNLYQWRR